MSVQYKDGTFGNIKKFEEAVREFVTNEQAKDIVVAETPKAVEDKISELIKKREEFTKRLQELAK